MINNFIKILVIEDEDYIREFIVLNLKISGFEVFEATSGEKAIEIIKDNIPHVVLLDIMLPGIDGYETCKKLREIIPNIAVIMLTAKSQDMDKIMGLEMGADDYIVKPFNPLELIARIRSLIRRINLDTKKEENNIISGPFKLNLNAQKVFKNNTPLELTPKEYKLIKTFIQNPNKALSRDELLDLAWGDDFFGEPKTLDVHVRRLREKIEDIPSNPMYICTVWGHGYMWKDTYNE